MHQNILSFMKMLYIIPCKDPILRQRMPVFHDLMFLLALFLIDKITDQHIQAGIPCGDISQRLQNPEISALFHPVITVNHFKIQTRSLFQSRIDRRSMSSVLLMNRFNNRRISGRILICNGSRPVCGTVIHDQNFHILPARKQ